MKKIFSFAIVLGAAAMVSCGGNNASKPAEAEAQAAEQCEGCCDKAEGACCEQKAEGECCGEGECAKKAEGECCGEGECAKKAEGECCQEKAE